MTRHQRARRVKFWRGFLITLFLLTGWAALSGLAGSITT